MIFFPEITDKGKKDFFFCHLANNNLSEESYFVSDYSHWDILEENVLGWRKGVTVGEEWSKEEMQQKLYELFPR